MAKKESRPPMSSLAGKVLSGKKGYGEASQVAGGERPVTG